MVRHSYFRVEGELQAPGPPALKVAAALAVCAAALFSLVAPAQGQTQISAMDSKPETIR